MAMGPNDYHVDPNNLESGLQPGLGKDELSPEAAAAMRTKSGQAMLALKEELKVVGAQLTEKERELVVREQAVEKRERELAAAEARSGGVAEDDENDENEPEL